MCVKSAFLFADSKKCLIFAIAIREITSECKGSGALVQLVRIRACHARGQGFESPTHRTKEDNRKVVFFFLYLFESPIISRRPDGGQRVEGVDLLALECAGAYRRAFAQ